MHTNRVFTVWNFGVISLQSALCIYNSSIATEKFSKYPKIFFRKRNSAEGRAFKSQPQLVVICRDVKRLKRTRNRSWETCFIFFKFRYKLLEFSPIALSLPKEFFPCFSYFLGEIDSLSKVKSLKFILNFDNRELFLPKH